MKEIRLKLSDVSDLEPQNADQWYLIKLGRALGCDVWIATIKLFIVAPQERRHHVVYQLNRPVFRGSLRDVCKYIPYDKLESTLAKIEDFQGYLQVGLIEKIAESCSVKDTS